jgi:hypothetical protein
VKLSDIKVASGARAVATPKELEDLSRLVGARMPDGYAEYMLALGEGVLGGTYVRIYPPWRIAKELEAWRARIREYWFWSGVSQETALESIILGDTLDGDELIFHPSDPDQITVLPRNSDDSIVAGRGLWSALEWLCSSGVLTGAFRERRFEPFDSRTERA